MTAGAKHRRARVLFNAGEPTNSLSMWGIDGAVQAVCAGTPRRTNGSVGLRAEGARVGGPGQLRVGSGPIGGGSRPRDGMRVPRLRGAGGAAGAHGPGYRRFRCHDCGKRCNERSAGLLHRARYPSDVVALVVLRRLRYRLTLRDLGETFLMRGIAFSHGRAAKRIDGRDQEAKLAPVLAGELRRRRHGRGGARGRDWHVDETYPKVRGRWCYLYRAIDRDGRLVDVMLGERRDMAAAKAFFRSARSAAGVMPARVTTDGHCPYPRAIRATLGRRVGHRNRWHSAERRGRRETSSWSVTHSAIGHRGHHA